MKLLITRSAGRNNSKPNIEKLEMLSTEFNNATFNINDNDIPIIIFTDTEESFFINKMYDKIARLESLLEFEILQSDLVAITGSGGGGGGAVSGMLQIIGGTTISETEVKQITDGEDTGTALWLTTKTANNYGPGGVITYNSSFGENVLINSNDLSIANAGFGSDALSALTSGYYNSAFGAGAMQNWNDTFDMSATRGQNTAVGAYSQYTRTDGKWNTSLGSSSMQNGSSGSFNLVVGSHAGEGLSGSWNTCVGTQAGGTVSGNYNVIVGAAATAGGGVTSGNNNLIINSVDSRVGITTGSNNVIIGGVQGVGNVSDTVIIGTGNNVRRMSFDSTGQMTITTAPTTGTGATTEKILVRDTVAGAIKQVDYAVTNATASALSAATLNATYATATLGFRVICMSISGGALMYTKTGASTWASTPLTVVA